MLKPVFIVGSPPPPYLSFYCNFIIYKLGILIFMENNCQALLGANIQCMPYSERSSYLYKNIVQCLYDTLFNLFICEILFIGVEYL